MEYRSLYALGKEKLAAAGVPEADLDARLLLEYVCHTSRNDLLVHGDREVAETEQQACKTRKAYPTAAADRRAGVYGTDFFGQ